MTISDLRRAEAAYEHQESEWRCISNTMFEVDRKRSEALDHLEEAQRNYLRSLGWVSEDGDWWAHPTSPSIIGRTEALKQTRQ